MAERTTGSRYLRNNGRIAGHGCIEDDYSETSGCKNREKYGAVRFPHDNIDPSRMNGEVIIVQKGKKK